MGVLFDICNDIVYDHEHDKDQKLYRIVAKYKVDQDIDIILAMDKRYKDRHELIESDIFKAAVRLCRASEGMRLPEAYRICMELEQ